MSSNTQGSAAFSDVFARLESELKYLQSAIRTPKARCAALTMIDQCIESDAANSSILTKPQHACSNLQASCGGARAHLLLQRIPANWATHGLPRLVLSFATEMVSWIHVTHVCRRWRQIALEQLDALGHTILAHRAATRTGSPERRPGAQRNMPLVHATSGGRLVRKDTFSPAHPANLPHKASIYLRDLSSIHYSARSSKGSARRELQPWNTSNSACVNTSQLSTLLDIRYSRGASEVTNLLHLPNPLRLVTCSSWPTNVLGSHSQRRGSHL